MSDAYVNFYSRLDPGGYGRGAQAFEGRAGQTHRPDAAVGSSAAAATEVSLAAGVEYAEIKSTSGDVFACILPGGAGEADRVAARVRIDAGEKIVLSRALEAPATLYLWSV